MYFLGLCLGIFGIMLCFCFIKFVFIFFFFFFFNLCCFFFFFLIFFSVPICCSTLCLISILILPLGSLRATIVRPTKMYFLGLRLGNFGIMLRFRFIERGLIFFFSFFFNRRRMPIAGF